MDPSYFRLVSDNPFGVIGEAMIVSTYTGIFLLVGVALLGSCLIFRKVLLRTRIVLGVVSLLVAAVLYFGFAASIGG
jgi:hypothetical protein